MHPPRLLLVAAAVMALAVLLASNLTTGVRAEERIAFEQQGISSAWHSVGAAPSSARISLLFALKHSAAQLTDLHETATSVSTPGQDAYRRYLTLAQMNERFAPPAESENTVVQYLKNSLGLEPTPNATAVPTEGAKLVKLPRPVISIPAPGWVRVEDITVKDAAALLRTDFKVYEKTPSTEPVPTPSTPPTPQVAAVDHTSDASFIRAPSGYSLPAEVAAVVDFVGGVTKLPGQRFQAHVVNVDSTTDEQGRQHDSTYVVTTRFLRAQYNIPASQSGNDSATNRQVVPQFLEQYYAPADLRTYLIQNRITPLMEVSKVIGPNYPANPGGEASLDIQLVMGMAPGIRTELWSFAGRRDQTSPPSNFNQEPFLDWMVLIASQADPPLVHSVSYADDEKDCTPAYMTRLDIEFQKAAARGLSILFASGDDGIGSVDVRAGKPCTQANPTFPSSSPWITSIGGTQLAPIEPTLRGTVDSSVTREEVTCSSSTGCVVTTGGGFSHHFTRPAYQSAAVDAYLALAKKSSLVPPAPWFNSSNRGYPDIAALATNFEIFIGGRTSRIGGTSASSPVIAAMISLWNDQLVRKGKPQLGFINPWLMQTVANHGTEVVQDVTQGNNACSQSALLCCAYGFHAAKGWDPVTGVGTPNWLELAKWLEE